MLYEILHPTIIIVLLAIICFLLYKLYRIKYTERGAKAEFIPEKLKRDLENTGDDRHKEIEMRFRDINSKISGLERKMQKNESVIEKLIEDLG